MKIQIQVFKLQVPYSIKERPSLKNTIIYKIIPIKGAGLLSSVRNQYLFNIRLDFNADPDPVFCINAALDPDPDPGSQTNEVPCGSGYGSW
jgi:hypothetical protein